MACEGSQTERRQRDSTWPTGQSPRAGLEGHRGAGRGWGACVQAPALTSLHPPQQGLLTHVHRLEYAESPWAGAGGGPGFPTPRRPGVSKGNSAARSPRNACAPLQPGPPGRHESGNNALRVTDFPSMGENRA